MDEEVPKVQRRRERGSSLLATFVPHTASNSLRSLQSFHSRGFAICQSDNTYNDIVRLSKWNTCMDDESSAAPA